MAKMLKKVSRGHLLHILGILLFAYVAYLGCAAGTKVTKQEDAALSAREKARQDSIRKFEAMKNWSLGHENFKNKEYERVARYLWKVIELDKERIFKDVYSELARTYFQLGKIDSAEAVYKLGVEVFPDNKHLHRSLAYIYENRGDADLAIEHYEKVVELDPESLDDWRRLGPLYAKQDRNEDAIRAYQKIIELDPNDSEARTILTALYRTSGDEQAAIDNMELALKNEPDNQQLLFELGRLYRASENWEKAIEKYRALLKLKPDDIIVREDLAAIYKKMENYRAAINEYSNILKIDSSNKKALAEIADSYLSLGDLRRARQYANRVLRLDRGYGQAYIIRGKIVERAVEQCQQDEGREINFDDKLMYQLAEKEYKKALDDIAVKQSALAHINSLEPVLPKQEDFFMHKGQTKPKSKCYQWLLQ